jgi:hypothetical protein
MSKGPFHPHEFVPTQCATAADKADFGNTVLHFFVNRLCFHLEAMKLLRRSMGTSVADHFWERMAASKPHPDDVSQGEQQ